MSRIIKTIRSGIIVEYDAGRFDDWCVYLTVPPKGRFAPQDAEYFTYLRAQSQKHGFARVYADFVKIYDKTSAVLSSDVLDAITEIAAGYGEDSQAMATWLTVIYAGMVAEENKERTVLKKRIKRLGVHQVLIENVAPAVAAAFSRRKPWQALAEIMKKKGF